MLKLYPKYAAWTFCAWKEYLVYLLFTWIQQASGVRLVLTLLPREFILIMHFCWNVYIISLKGLQIQLGVH